MGLVVRIHSQASFLKTSYKSVYEGVLIPEIRVSKAPRYYELLITYREVGNAKPVQADGHKDFRKQSSIIQKVSTPSYTDLESILMRVKRY